MCVGTMTYMTSRETIRARRRSIERTSRRRRQAILTCMRDEVQWREQQLSKILREADDRRSASDESDAAISQSIRHLHPRIRFFLQLHHRLAIDVRRLNRINVRLRQVLRRYTSVYATLEQAINVDTKESNQETFHGLVAATFQPLSTDESAEIIRRTMATMTNAVDDEPMKESRCFGWVDRRRRIGETEYMETHKPIFNCSAEDLQEATWKMLTGVNGTDRNRRPRPDGSVQIRVLQRLNKDTVIVHREFIEASSSQVYHAVCLVFRGRSEDGTTLLCGMRSLPPLELQNPMIEHETWRDVHTWFEFENSMRISTTVSDDDDGTAPPAGVCGARRTSLAPAGDRHGRLNELLRAVQWETAIVAAPRLVPGGTAANL